MKFEEQENINENIKGVSEKEKNQELFKNSQNIPPINFGKVEKSEKNEKSEKIVGKIDNFNEGNLLNLEDEKSNDKSSMKSKESENLGQIKKLSPPPHDFLGFKEVIQTNKNLLDLFNDDIDHQAKKENLNEDFFSEIANRKK